MNLIFTDLDDTLFSTYAKHTTQPLRQVTESSNGRHSYMSETQKAFFDILKGLGTVIPVTTRGSKTYKAVSLPFDNKAVVANGAIIQDAQGRPDLDWFDHIKAISKDRQKDLEDMQARAEQWGGRVRVRINEELDTPIYLVVKANRDTFSTPQEAEDILGDVRQDLIESGLTQECMVHLNGNNLAITPNGISKKSAVAHLLDLSPKSLSFGVGDSTTDVPFMALCDFLIAPKEAQLISKLKDLV